MDIRIALAVAAEFATIPFVIMAVSYVGPALDKWARGHKPVEPNNMPHSKPASTAPKL